MTTPKTSAPEWAASQGSPWATVNEALRIIEAGSGLFRVEDNDATAPPGSCADGAQYIPAATATGAWAGKEKNIAIAKGANAANGWAFIAPEEGMRARIKDENIFQEYDGSAWGTPSSATTFGNAADYRTGTEAAKAMAPDQIWAAAAPVALTDAATVAVDLSTGFNFTVTLGGNRTLGNPSNVKDQSGYIAITQDGTGSRTLAYGANWEFAGGVAPTLSTAAGAKDLLFYQVLGASSIFANLIKAVA